MVNYKHSYSKTTRIILGPFAFSIDILFVFFVSPYNFTALSRSFFIFIICVKYCKRRLYWILHPSIVYLPGIIGLFNLYYFTIAFSQSIIELIFLSSLFLRKSYQIVCTIKYGGRSKSTSISLRLTTKFVIASPFRCRCKCC